MMKTLTVCLLVMFSLCISESSFAQKHKSGKSLKVLPNKHHQINHRGKSYYYTGGSFYRHKSNVYLSISAPIGAIVPGLPGGYITFGVGPSRYYYLGGVYYRHAPGGYRVVEKPEEAEAVLASAGSDKLIIYPADGQTEEQKNRDKYECHTWASDESGYDPTDASSDNLLRTDYNRAMSACLEARRYVVK